MTIAIIALLVLLLFVFWTLATAAKTRDSIRHREKEDT